jgi:hypothetical protein
MLATAALAFAVMVAFHPGFLSPGETIRWILLTAAVPLLWCFSSPPIIPRPVLWAGLGCLSWMAATLLWTQAPLDGWNALLHWLVLALTFSVGASTDNPRPILAGIALGAAVNGIVAVLQAIAGVEPTGLFANRNLLAEAGLFGVVSAIVLRGWWLVLLLPALAAFSGATWPMAAKTVIVGATAALALTALRRRSWRVLAGTLLMSAAVLAGATFLDGESGSFSVRISIWADVLSGLTPWGHGIGSFAATFPGLGGGGLVTGTRMVSTAYNDFLTLAFEIGVPAIFPAGITLYALRHGDGPGYAVFAAFLGLGLVNYPAFAPASAFIGAVLAGHLCRGGAGAGDPALDCRRQACGLTEKPGTERQGLAGHEI